MHLELNSSQNSIKTHSNALILTHKIIIISEKMAENKFNEKNTLPAFR